MQGGGRRSRTRATRLPDQNSLPAPSPAAAALLAQKARITNWAQFAGGNNITGWDEDWARPDGVRPCQWTGVGCDAYDFTVTAL